MTTLTKEYLTTVRHFDLNTSVNKLIKHMTFTGNLKGKKKACKSNRNKTKICSGLRKTKATDLIRDA